MLMNGRSREVIRIREANRAAAVGKLLLGQLKNWQEFLEIDAIDLESMPRRRLKSGHHDVQKRLSKEIGAFCSRNFGNMTAKKLSMLYDQIKSYRGLEIPLQEFEERFSTIKPQALGGHPKHATLVISLWGMQFKYPEHYFAEDIQESLTRARDLSEQLKTYSDLPHTKAEQDRDEIALMIRGREFSVRACLLSCFNLMEAYFNGLAWEFSKDSEAISKLSNKKRELIEDSGRTKFRDKLVKYPEIISGQHLWDDKEDPIRTFLDEMKPFRDALVHPSPFTVPEKFGGHDKLQILYRLDLEIAENCANLSLDIISSVQKHLYGENFAQPPWLIDLKRFVEPMP
jgi:hypothetical protein